MAATLLHSQLHPSPSPNWSSTNLHNLRFPPLLRGDAVRVRASRQRPSVEKLYSIFVERNITPERAAELGVSRWRLWETGKSQYHWEWKVDEQVYILKGCVQVTPHNCPDSAFFYAGDLVRFPKWFSAYLTFDDQYQQRYRFLAYGDD